jgi:hypothetical protein
LPRIRCPPGRPQAEGVLRDRPAPVHDLVRSEVVDGKVAGAVMLALE